MKAYTTLLMIAMLAIAANAVTKNSASTSLSGDDDEPPMPQQCKDICAGLEWCENDCSGCMEDNGNCPDKCNQCKPCGECLMKAHKKAQNQGQQQTLVKTSGVDAQARLDRVNEAMKRRHQMHEEAMQQAQQERQNCNQFCMVGTFDCNAECGKPCGDCGVNPQTGQADCPETSLCSQECRNKCGQCGECHWRVDQNMQMRVDQCHTMCNMPNFSCYDNCDACSECETMDDPNCPETCSNECRGKCGGCLSCHHQKQRQEAREMDPCFDECHEEWSGFSCYNDCNDCYSQTGCFDDQRCDDKCRFDNDNGCNQCHKCHNAVSRLQDPCFDECDEGWCYDNCMYCKDDPSKCSKECVQRCTDCAACHTKANDDQQKGKPQKGTNGCPHGATNDGKCVLMRGDGDCNNPNNVCGEGLCHQESGQCRVQPPCFNECDQGWCEDNCMACFNDIGGQECAPMLQECTKRCSDCADCVRKGQADQHMKEQGTRCVGGEQKDGTWLLCEGDSDCNHPNNNCAQGLICMETTGMCFNPAPQK